MKDTVSSGRLLSSPQSVSGYVPQSAPDMKVGNESLNFHFIISACLLSLGAPLGVLQEHSVYTHRNTIHVNTCTCEYMCTYTKVGMCTNHIVSENYTHANIHLYLWCLNTRRFVKVGGQVSMRLSEDPHGYPEFCPS